MKLITSFLSISFFLFANCDPTIIKTVSAGARRKHVTTGNALGDNLNFNIMHLPYKEEETLPVAERLKENYYRFSKLRNKLILDYANEDPKNFRPDIPDYWLIASKRGFLFNFLAAVLLVLGLWVFMLRLAYGDCGGFKTIVRKPSKFDRYIIQSVGVIGIAIFLFGCIYGTLFLLKDRQEAATVGHSLEWANKTQLEAVDKAIDFIKAKNKSYLKVFNSSTVIELFQIGSFLGPIRSEYVKSLKSATTLAGEMFTKTKNSMATRFVVIIITVISCIMLFSYAYKTRKVLVSLGLTFILVLCLNYNLNAISDAFNVWSINIDLCKQSLTAFEIQKGPIKNREIKGFNSIITCLSHDGKKALSSQLNSFDLAKHTIHQILKNHFRNKNSSVEMLNYLFSAKSLSEGYQIIEQAIDNTTQDDSDTRKQLQTYLKMTKEIDQHYLSLAHLNKCSAQIEWVKQVNYHVCQKGLKYQHSMIWGFGMLLISTLLIAASIYLSENIIRGLYNEEIQYVKTNKLRYDWN